MSDQVTTLWPEPKQARLGTAVPSSGSDQTAPATIRSR
jgi:hypothetical protein